ncbi:SUMF1/EgtB/PvdO family nonheme iron enzyme [bacterium]
MDISKETGYIKYDIGDMINDQLEIEKIYEGGLGRVYFTYCHTRQMRVVLKTIKEEIWERYELYKEWKAVKKNAIHDTLNATKILTLGEYFLFMFFREARISCQMQGHPNLTSGLTMWWTDHGQIFFETQYVQDSIDMEYFYQKITQENDTQSLSILETLHFAISFCNTIIYINDEVIRSYNSTRKDVSDHVTGFVHRDIKPDNVLLTQRNMFKLIDLGIAKYITSARGITRLSNTGIKIGHDWYSSPEQKLNFDQVSPASDIYSFGATVCRLLGCDTHQLEYRSQATDITLQSNIPEELQTILLKCIEYDNMKRYQNFKPLKNDLVKFLSSVKSGKIEVNENLRCRSCGYVHFKPSTTGAGIDVETKRGKNQHKFARILKGSFLSGCCPEHQKKIMAKFSDYINEIDIPSKQVMLEAYDMDLFSVTNIQYFNFIKDTEYPNTPIHWKRFGDPPFDEEIVNHPVVNVSFEDALAYCKWLGYRLPTGLEWERAARGDQGNLYPWGDNYSSNKCNSAESGNQNVVAVDSYPEGRSPFGCYNMMGNVYEWVDESPNDSDQFKNLAGGCWAVSCELMGIPFLRDLAVRTNKGFLEGNKDVFGFRCVRDVDPTELISKTRIMSESQVRCPVCSGDFIPFKMKDIKIPENNIFNWNGYFDTE